MVRRLVAPANALASVLVLLPSANAKDRANCATTHIAPICHLGAAPICLCITASDSSCA
ncbi:MAG: hypothetical protein ABI488_13580 [Polyangiaceae bacterium]